MELDKVRFMGHILCKNIKRGGVLNRKLPFGSLTL